MAERRKCDIVMQGGVTSGVVYPGLITKLAEQYDFQNIGGTSAGAIAACLTAAAEYARRRNVSPDPFLALNKVAAWLGSSDPDPDDPEIPVTPYAQEHSNLFALFQPQPSMEGLFQFALMFLTVGWLPKVEALIQLFAFEIALGLSLGITLGFFAAPGHGWLLTTFIILLAAIASLAGIAVAIAISLLLHITTIPKNFFGICTGNAEPAGEGAIALVPWLHRKINTIAGKPLNKPLTFGDLESTCLPGETDDPSIQSGPLKQGINLRMMTTCLTWQRPFTLPFTTHLFYFSPKEFLRYFPAEIVDWLKAHPPQHLDTDESPRRRRIPIDIGELYPLPDQKDLPIVVAARLSLSFPLLFCTVPLYAVDFSLRVAKANEPTPAPIPGGAIPHNGPYRPERVWFTDGGICNNFPLHLFDAPLPLWPTFGIDLSDVRCDGLNRDFRTYLPNSNNGGVSPVWTRITSGGLKGTFDLAIAIVNSARNWVNSLQAAVPGYRDRIVHIALDKKEGGLNLVMPPGTVATLNEYGTQAGELLIDHFINGIHRGQPTPMTWDNQRWVRYRSTMAQLETFLKNLNHALHHPHPGDSTYFDLLERGPDDSPSGYRLDPSLLADALAETHGADALGALMSKTVPRDDQTTLNSCGAITDKLCPPKPQPDLVIRPHF